MYAIRSYYVKQEVVSADRKLSGVVFYEPGSTNLLDGIKVDQPCLLMIKKDGGEVSLSLSDPTQKLSEINVEISGSYKGENIVPQEGKTNIKIVLPINEFAGKTVTIHLKKI